LSSNIAVKTRSMCVLKKLLIAVVIEFMVSPSRYFIDAVEGL